MKRIFWALSTAAAVVLGMTTASLAAGPVFECPWKGSESLKLSQSEISALFPAADPLDDPAKLYAAIDAMRAQGVDSSNVVNTLVALYCPTVAANTTLTDPQKASRVQKFAVRIAGLVYSYEGADEIILDVPFSPPVVDAINSKAAAAGLTPEKWIAKVVDTGLMAQP